MAFIGARTLRMHMSKLAKDELLQKACQQLDMWVVQRGGGCSGAWGEVGTQWSIKMAVLL
jgi:hypothetical protein